jgi:hypothetical protein
MASHSNYTNYGTYSVAASGTLIIEIDATVFNELQVETSITFASTSSITGFTCNVTNGFGPAVPNGQPGFYVNGGNPITPAYDSVGQTVVLNPIVANDGSPQTVNTVFNVNLAQTGGWIKVTLRSADATTASTVTLLGDAL